MSGTDKNVISQASQKTRISIGDFASWSFNDERLNIPVRDMPGQKRHSLTPGFFTGVSGAMQGNQLFALARETATSRREDVALWHVTAEIPAPDVDSDYIVKAATMESDPGKTFLNLLRCNRESALVIAKALNPGMTVAQCDKFKVAAFIREIRERPAEFFALFFSKFPSTKAVIWSADVSITGLMSPSRRLVTFVTMRAEYVINIDCVSATGKSVWRDKMLPTVRSAFGIGSPAEKDYFVNLSCERARQVSAAKKKPVQAKAPVRAPVPVQEPEPKAQQAPLQRRHPRLLAHFPGRRRKAEQ